MKKFRIIEGDIFRPAPLSKLEWPAILGAMGLGFSLSLLFFMDHNIAGALVNSPDNRSVGFKVACWHGQFVPHPCGLLGRGDREVWSSQIILLEGRSTKHTDQGRIECTNQGHMEQKRQGRMEL